MGNCLPLEVGFVIRVKKDLESNQDDDGGGSVEVDLGDDLLREVFHHLPWESINRFKCVDKRWRSLLSDPCYRRRALDPPISGLLFYGKARCKVMYAPLPAALPEDGTPVIDPEWPLAFMPNHHVFCDVHACNGLVLCARREATHRVGDSYRVCNPATKAWASVLPPPNRFHSSLGAFLAAEPRESSHFRIVRVVKRYEPPHHEHLELQIYSSETGEWVNHPDGGPCPRGVHTKSDIRGAVYSGGSLYMIMGNAGVCKVDVEDGSLQLLAALPRHFSSSAVDAVLRPPMEAGGPLQLYSCSSRKVRKWELEGAKLEPKERWNVRGMPSQFGPLFERSEHELLAVAPTGDVCYLMENPLYGRQVRCRVFACNMGTGHVEQVAFFGDRNKVVVGDEEPPPPILPFNTHPFASHFLDFHGQRRSYQKYHQKY